MKCRTSNKLKISTFPGPSRVLRRGLFALIFWTGCSYGAGLGNIEVQSSLGQQLRASISLIGADTKEQTAACVKARIESLDGVPAGIPRVTISQSESSPSIRLTTRENINEPALNIVVELGCQASVRRTYQVLLDPASALAAVAPGSAGIAPANAVSRKTPAATGFDTQNPLANASAPNPPGPTRNSARNRVKALDASPDRASSPNDAPLKTAAKAKTGARSVLRMAPVDDPIDDAKIALRLKFSDTLTIPAGGASPSGPSAAPAVLDAAAMAARTEELVKTSQALELARLQTEALALKSENARIKKQEAAAKGSIDAMRDEMLTWIQVLGIVLAASLVALGWLAWRFNAIRRDQHQATWNELFPESTASGDVIAPAAELDMKPLVATESLGKPEANPVGDAGSANSMFDSVIVQAPSAPVNLEKKTPPQPFVSVQEPIEEGKTPVSNRSVLAPLPEKDRQALEKPINWNGSPRSKVSPKVEEISDVMELVEVWMALHESEKVLELLEPFNEVDQPASPLPWLCLLDVYSSLNDRSKYEAILERIKTLFNVKLAPWDARLDQHAPRVLADFPHIVEKIIALWDSDDIGPYLDSLLIDDRDGAREGFDLPVYRDIARLTALAKDPQRPRNTAELKTLKAYAALFASPSPQLLQADVAAPVKKPAVKKKMIGKEKSAKKEQPEQTTAVASPNQPDVSTISDAAATPALTLEERTSESNAIDFYETFSLEEPGIPTPGEPADSNENAAVTRAPTAAQSQDRAKPLSQPRQGDASGFPSIHQNSISLPHPIGHSEASDADAIDDPWAPSTWRRTAPPMPPTINKEMSPMAIKLHLAIAYQDIGDVEGACLLLNEVIAEGTPDQCRQAKMLLAALA